MKALFSKIAAYLRSSKAELEKVTWPSKQDTIRYTIIIIISCTAAAAFFAAVDFGLSRSVELIVSRNAPATTKTPTPTTNEPPVTTNAPSIEAVDQNGKPVNVQATPVPVNPTTPSTSSTK